MKPSEDPLIMAQSIEIAEMVEKQISNSRVGLVKNKSKNAHSTLMQDNHWKNYIGESLKEEKAWNKVFS
jgi:hypothetical protein